MHHYEFPKNFRALYDKTVDLYAKGRRGPASFFDPADQAFLSANGISPQNLYDYAEDHLGYGEPGYDLALGIELIRRDFFLNVQHGSPSSTVLDPSKMPGKTDAIRNIEWLPRLIPKARAKLRGELPESLMYCCGGDRRFFKTHNILPSEFLSLIWRHADDEPVIDWVVKRSSSR